MEMENRVLSTLEYKICLVTPLDFLRRFSKTVESENNVFLEHAKFLLEVSHGFYDSIKYPPSLLAAASVYVAHLVWDDTMVFYTGYALESVEPVALDLKKWVEECSGQSAVFRKYYSHRHSRVAHSYKR